MFIIGQIDFFLYLCGQITTCYDRTQGLCEMKFSQGKFSVGGDYAEKIQERIRRTMEYTENSKPVISVLVSKRPKICETLLGRAFWEARLSLISLKFNLFYNVQGA